MTFEQQAELLEYIHSNLIERSDGGYNLVIVSHLDQAQVDDLYLTAQRLRRMSAYEVEIKRLVTGQ
jgi:hypothetical protein